MDRRTLLAMGAIGFAGSAGCLARFGGGCPEPDLTDELSYDENGVDRLPLRADEGIVLVTSRASFEEMQGDQLALHEVDAEMIRDIDYDVACALVFQVEPSNGARGITVLGVERESPATVGAHTCNQRDADKDVPNARYVLVYHDGDVPDGARLTHWVNGEAREITEQPAGGR